MLASVPTVSALRNAALAAALAFTALMPTAPVMQASPEHAQAEADLYVTHNGAKTYDQLVTDLKAAGYPGPWEIRQMLAAYERADDKVELQLGGVIDIVQGQYGGLRSYWDSYLPANLRGSGPNIEWGRQGGTASACGDIMASESATFCPADNTIYLPSDYMSLIYRNWGPAGAASTLAHEYGHYIQWLTLDRSFKGEENELRADCMAGAYEGWIFATADPKLASSVRDGLIAQRRALASEGHGSANQRANFFQTGWNSQTNPMACLSLKAS